MKNILILMAAIWGLIGCQKNEFKLYKGEAALIFGPKSEWYYKGIYSMADTVRNYTFYFDAPEITQTDIQFHLYTIGNPSDRDRSFKLRQIMVEGVENAVAGEDYVAFDSPQMIKEYVIPAGKVSLEVPIRLLRNSKTSSLTLKFEIIENENFNVGMKELSWRRIVFSSALSRPNAWTKWDEDYSYGAYSRTKHEWMIQVSGEKWDQEFMEALEIDESSYYNNFFKLKLAEYNNRLAPKKFIDENNQEIVFP